MSQAFDAKNRGRDGVTSQIKKNNDKNNLTDEALLLLEKHSESSPCKYILFHVITYMMMIINHLKQLPLNEIIYNHLFFFSIN
jgi:hypothetical protein